LSGVQNPFLWESDEMECVESWLGVLICRAGAGAAADAHGKSARDSRAARVRKYAGADAPTSRTRGARVRSRRIATAPR
jgi:hypothetical protein